MTKRKSDTDDSFIDRLKNIFYQLNNLATFMYFKKVALSVESFAKVSHSTAEEIHYLALIAPQLIKVENGFIMMKIKDRKKNTSALMKERIDNFNAQLLLLPQNAKETLDGCLSKNRKLLASAMMPFKDQRIEIDPPRCLLKCLMNIKTTSFYKDQMSEVVEEKSLEPVYGIFI
jgi:hypothetical protein